MLEFIARPSFVDLTVSYTERRAANPIRASNILVHNQRSSSTYMCGRGKFQEIESDILDWEIKQEGLRSYAPDLIEGRNILYD